jgi:hypothetical protein
MEDSTQSFNNLSMLIEDANVIIIEMQYGKYNCNSFIDAINVFFEKYEYKPNIIKGLTSTIEFGNLLESKRHQLSMILHKLNSLIEKTNINGVIDDDEKYLDFSMNSVIRNRLIPLIQFVISEVNLCLGVKSNDLETKSTELQWYGQDTELIELTKALIENGNLKGTQKDIFIGIQKAFNIELKNIDQAITKYNFRHKKNETIFLDKLRSMLLNYISNKLEQNKQNR